MRYYGCAGCAATPTSVPSSTVIYVYSDRPLTVQERLLARLWLRDRISMAAIVLLSLRLEDPELKVQDILELPREEIHMFLVGLHLSVRDDYIRQEALTAWEAIDPQKEKQH